ncbi:hypothetical protein EGW08_016525 [Elysia chlorotica]|uniref:Thioredoxin domain-containing protein n=1 Tax=Elysia chlorotica TaxID=188477 RepID=A0A433T2J1_ELYCH|nr:hypothetical protein EGW08_016525 [Elysia chlorotica]
MTVKRSERFRPYIVVFYAWWAEHIGSYLSLIKESVEEMQRLSVRARFALVNVGQEKTVISRYVDVKYFKKIPFIAVFQREKGKDTVNQTLVHLSHPSLFYLSKALREHGVWLYDAWDKLWDCNPYLFLDYTHYSDIREGPRGYLCMAWTSNLTDDAVTEVRTQPKTKSTLKPMSSVEKQMARVNGIPILTDALWDAVMEKSQVNIGTLEWEPDVQITVLAFIRSGCGSCNKKMHTFQEIHKELKKKENARLYLVNCSSEASLCEGLGVQGFPTVSAFRSFAALASTRCSIHPPEKPYVRRDYHGPLSTGDLMPWIESMSTNGLSFVGFKNIGNPLDMIEDVRLVATVIPRFSNYLPLAPGGQRSYFFTPGCLRLACERLFGLATCYVANSKEIPHGEFTKTHAVSGMVVSEVRFERKDGVSLTLMRLGKSMLRLIEKETLSDLHLFHSAHQYSLHPKQTCEQNHDLCAQIIASFVRDHIRLPVTHLTSETFHTKNNPIFEVNKPVLIALSHAQNLTQDSGFMQLLIQVARRLYHNVTVTVLDTDQFPAWAGSFVPHHYPRLFMDSPDSGPLHIYPRVCLVNWTDHEHAAFYPPLHTIFSKSILRQLKITETNASLTQPTESFDIDEQTEAVDYKMPQAMDVNSMLFWDEDNIVSFVKTYLEHPDEHLVQTQHF